MMRKENLTKGETAKKWIFHMTYIILWTICLFGFTRWLGGYRFEDIIYFTQDTRIDFGTVRLAENKDKIDIMSKSFSDLDEEQMTELIESHTFKQEFLDKGLKYPYLMVSITTNETSGLEALKIDKNGIIKLYRESSKSRQLVTFSTKLEEFEKAQVEEIFNQYFADIDLE